jgi:PAS domain S-box-containing protein
MLSGSESESTKDPLSSTHQKLSVIEERGTETTSTPLGNQPSLLTTFTVPLTPSMREDNRAAAITFELKTFVVAKASGSAALEGTRSIPSNLSVRSGDSKNEDLPDFQALFERTPDPQLILKPDAGFTIVAVNEAYLEATMTQREWILNKSLFEVFPDNPSDPNADGVRNLRHSLQQVLEGGVVDMMPIQKYDVRRPEIQGGGFEERYWSPVNIPVFGKAGGVDFIIHRVEDVTRFIYLKQQEVKQQTRAEALQERTQQMEAEIYNHNRDIQKKEEALRISHERYSTLTSILPVGIFHTDLEGHCLYVNPYWQTLTGIPWAAAKNHPWLTLFQFVDEAPVLNAWKQCQTTGSCQIEFCFFGTDHKEYWVLAQLAAERVGNEVKGYVGSLINITELKELEQTRIEAIQQAEEHQRKLVEEAEKHRRNQERFIDTMCHELRNSLNGIYGNVGLLESIARMIERLVREASSLELETTLREKILRQLEDNQESLAAIYKCVCYQQVITDDVLHLSKLEAGKVELNLIDFDLIKLVKDNIGMLESQANQKQIRLRLDLPPSPIQVKGDPNRLTQVLLNLLSNALKFTLEKGEVSVGVSILEKTRTHNVLRFTVKDTGIGMSEEEQAKLFDRFMQASPKISAEHGGSGLGLMISKNLIELMEGKIEVKSKKWKGTEFSFTIKLAPAPLLEQAQGSAPAHFVKPRKASSPTNNPLHILIAEDNLINQKILVKQLQRAGHTCYVANNGQEAIEAYDKTPLDLIFMDIEMPVKNGLEATQVIRQKERASLHSPIPIIGLSGNARLEHQEQALSVGMNAYLTKPYDKEKLLEMLDQYTPFALPQTAVTHLTPKSMAFFSSATPLQPHEESPSFTVFALDSPEEQERVLKSARVSKKEKLKERAPFWNNTKLALATATVGAIAVGMTVAAKKR